MLAKLNNRLKAGGLTPAVEAIFNQPYNKSRTSIVNRPFTLL